MSAPAVGARVVLVSTTDPYTNLEPGAEGTVFLVDAMGTVHVDWDGGSSLGMVPGEDSWQLLSCTECGEPVLDTEACFNQKDVCVECCGRLLPDGCCGPEGDR